MSIQSTRTITRSEAEKMYRERIVEHLSRLHDMEDSELEELLDETYYNYTIDG